MLNPFILLHGINRKLYYLKLQECIIFIVYGFILTPLPALKCSCIVIPTGISNIILYYI